MTTKQLQCLLRGAIQRIQLTNNGMRERISDPWLAREDKRRISMHVAKTDMWLAKARRAVAKPRTIKHK